MTERRKIHWGILGAGNIAKRFASALAKEPDSILWAVACRTEEKARAFAAEHPAEKAYGGYERLLQDTEIDAIYLALPHDLHLEWGLKVIAAGKALLCEKPLCMNADETRQLAAAAERSGVLMMEAMKQRFLPAAVKMREMVQAGAIGEVQVVETAFCDDRTFTGETYHTHPGVGGSLLDTGIYGAGYLDEYLHGDFKVVQAEARFRQGVDFYVNALLEFDGCCGRVECGFDCVRPRQAVLRGTTGTLVIEEMQRPEKVTLLRENQPPQVFRVPYEVDDFYSEIHHFVGCMQAGKKQSDLMPLSASVRCAEMLDAIRAAMQEIQ